MRRLTIAGIGALLLLVGIYFFPFGEDIVFKGILDYAEGDYWRARAYQYLIFGGMLIVGYSIIRYGPRGVVSPLTVCYALVAGVILLGGWI